MKKHFSMLLVSDKTKTLEEQLEQFVEPIIYTKEEALAEYDSLGECDDTYAPDLPEEEKLHLMEDYYDLTADENGNMVKPNPDALITSYEVGGRYYNMLHTSDGFTDSATVKDILAVDEQTLASLWNNTKKFTGKSFEDFCKFMCGIYCDVILWPNKTWQALDPSEEVDLVSMNPDWIVTVLDCIEK